MLFPKSLLISTITYLLISSTLPIDPTIPLVSARALAHPANQIGRRGSPTTKTPLAPPVYIQTRSPFEDDESEIVAPVPNTGRKYSYKQTSRVEIMRRKTNKRTLAARAQLVPRARVSGSSYPTCSDAGSNTNGLYSEIKSTTVSKNYQIITNTQQYTNAIDCANYQCSQYGGKNPTCAFVTFQSSNTMCIAYGYATGYSTAGDVGLTKSTGITTLFMGVDCATDDKTYTVTSSTCCNTYVMA